ncbi:MAG: secondary thiamine-phosphate synthase enzyme YjbQ [Deltaproteobacteria bacterium]|nr:secondary thiamine-phosphate synthase enzyme YjbQ [Deltaproteobacteria bacterium]
MHRESFVVATEGRGTTSLDTRVDAVIAASGVEEGLCTVFVHHTSASLIVCENADPTVRRDLEAFTARLVPDGDPIYRHTAEGPDDMAAHVRSILTQTSIGIPVAGGRLDLGTWQSLYLWEHRTHPHRRKISVVITG